MRPLFFPECSPCPYITALRARVRCGIRAPRRFCTSKTIDFSSGTPPLGNASAGAAASTPSAVGRESCPPSTRRIDPSSRSSSSGFSMKSAAPILVARMAVEMVACPLIMITGIAGYASLMRRSVSIPSIPGIQMSRSTREGRTDRSFSSASAPSQARAQVYPSSPRTPSSDFRMLASSSTTRIVPRSDMGDPPLGKYSFVSPYACLTLFYY
jgi:hypothetical protein